MCRDYVYVPNMYHTPLICMANLKPMLNDGQTMSYFSVYLDAGKSVISL